MLGMVVALLREAGGGGGGGGGPDADGAGAEAMGGAGWTSEEDCWGAGAEEPGLRVGMGASGTWVDEMAGGALDAVAAGAEGEDDLWPFVAGDGSDCAESRCGDPYGFGR